ncbi:uncharacterized protein LACBIDRAFT_329302 [Laccaria bicolor S238N-H82]|uniref:Predicted protein n=1 Tax=Laccaria bicolor (strain S238N-H82 / ATCC MYA-4686) TaxID=486041 RepID=B0DHL6_LACBS|nr:uncharacterized protein LACBIDRAFT_329302 [Laccaria bicolor S238N-H82]EDR05749.1 predicted protein [Laccaria bicolor S238N-H82]|eukprot:XP_001883425.1 predicted protein [Laccaria bicolor S238N-H82]
MSGTQLGRWANNGVCRENKADHSLLPYLTGALELATWRSISMKSSLSFALLPKLSQDPNENCLFLCLYSTHCHYTSHAGHWSPAPPSFCQKVEIPEKVYPEKTKLRCQFVSDFYVLGLELMAFSPEIVPRSYEMLGLAAHIRQSTFTLGIITQIHEMLGAAVLIWRSNMWGVKIHTPKIELPRPQKTGGPN